MSESKRLPMRLDGELAFCAALMAGAHIQECTSRREGDKYIVTMTTEPVGVMLMPDLTIRVAMMARYGGDD